MKRILLASIIIFLHYSSFSQSAGDYRSVATGNWTDNTTWERHDGTSWVAAPSGAYPQDTSGVITIRDTHNVTVDTDISIDETVIESGGTITVDVFNTLTVADGAGTDLDNNSGGTLVLSDDAFFDGSFLVVDGQFSNAGTITFDSGLSSITFNAGSEYEHAQNGSSIPVASWNATSTCNITGVTDTAPGNIDQNFGNLTWNCVNQGGTVNMGMSSNTTIIDGDFTISDTGGRVAYFSGTDGTTVTVKGDLIISGSSRISITTSVSVTTNVDGDYNNSSTGGCFLATTGTGILNVKVDFAQSAGSLRGNSTSGVNFNGTTLQTYTGGGSYNDVNFTIKNGSEVNMGTSSFSGSGDFTLESGGTIQSGSPAGIESVTTGGGNIEVSGTRTFTSGGKIIYNGGSAQNMGDETAIYSGLDIEINNSNGVSMENGLTISSGRILTLTTGALVIGSNTLTLNGTVSGSGTLTGSSTSNIVIGGTGSLGTMNFTSGGRQINDITLNRSSGSASLGTQLTITGTFTHSDGDLDFSGQILEINGSYSRTGGSIIPDGNSKLRITGTNANDALSFGATTISVFTLNNASGINTASSLTVSDSLNLFSGAFGGSGSVTMGSGSVIRRSGGSTSKSVSASTTFNVYYGGSSDITVGNELPTNSTDLNDLTINNSSTVFLGSNPITVNGILTLSNGTFDPGSNDVNMEGNFVSNSSGDFDSNTVVFAGNTTISGSVVPIFYDIKVNSGATLNLGTGTVRFAGTGNIDKQGTIEGGSSTINFNGTGTTISGGGAMTLNDVLITGTVTFPNSNVNVAGNWSFSSGNFDPGTGTVTFSGAAQDIDMAADNFYNLIIAGSGTKTLLAGMDLDNDLTISTTLDVSGSDYQINIGGDWTNNGTFTQQNGKVVFDGGATQQVLGTSKTTFNNIDLTNQSTPGLQIEVDTDLEGIFTPGANTTFDPDGSGGSSTFTLLSTSDNPTEDAMIAAIPGDATISGELNVQRYMSSEGDLWRYIASPLDGVTVADWQNSFPITGNFTGADDLGGANLPSLYYYDETVTGDLSNGWEAYPTTDNTAPIDPGTGYSAYMRQENGQITINVRGSFTNGVNRGTVDLGVTYTDTGSPDDDGWNLVGNPYPSTIDWESTDWTLTNVLPTIHTRDNSGDVGVFATYNRNTDLGTDGGTRYIASSQSFWIQTDGASPSMIATENVKASNQTTFFREAAPIDYMRITLEKGDYYDETIIHFRSEATDDFDRDYDSRKRMNDKYNIYSKSVDAEDLAINSFSEIQCDDIDVPLYFQDIDPGLYNLSFAEFESFETDFNIYLIDLKTNDVVDTKEQLNYEFEVTDDAQELTDLENGNRFLVRFAASEIDLDLDLSFAERVCENQEAEITVLSSKKGYVYQAYIGSEAVSDAKTSTGGDLVLSVPDEQMDYGTNTILINSSKPGCPAMSLESKAEIELNQLPEVTEAHDDEICSGRSAVLTASGAPANGKYHWYESVDDEDPILIESEGIFETPKLNESTNYFVASVNDADCESLERIEVTVTVTSSPATATTTDVQGCSPGIFSLTAEGATENDTYLWYESADADIHIEGENSKTFVTPEIEHTTSYYVSLLNENGCESPERTPATVFISEEDVFNPVIESVIQVCTNSPTEIYADGAPAGGSYHWFDSPTSLQSIHESENGEFEVPALESNTDYYVAVVNADGCMGQKEKVEIDVLDPPTVTAGDVEICEGQTALINASGAPDGGYYHWYREENDTEPIENEFGKEFETGNLFNSITYYVAALNSIGCEGEKKAAHIEVVEIPLSITGEDVIFCDPGEEVVLEATGAPDDGSYRWYGSETSTEMLSETSTLAINPEQSSTYYVTGTNRLGCESDLRFGLSVIKSTLPRPVPDVQLLNANSFGVLCKGDSAILSASGATNGENYHWYQNGIPDPVGSGPEYRTTDLHETITFTVKTINEDGCASDPDEIEINIFEPAKPTISINYNILQASEANTWQWYSKGSPIEGAVNRTFDTRYDASLDQMYVKITKNGCPAFSDPVTINSTLDKLFGSNIKIFPNPAKDILYINYPEISRSDNLEFLIVSIDGKILKRIKAESLKDENEHEIDISLLESGIYMLHIKDDDQIHISRFVKQ